jgi:tRNA-specific 2-thiouridylase
MPSVLVAMSGGVDSSVSACLLAEQGYEVLGSHMKLVHLSGGGVDHGCCGPNARADAERVAAAMGFPFEVHDVSEEFEETVIADFFVEHEAGRTPNPCVRCNEHIKFGAFLRRADEIGCDFVATGHYVRTTRDASGMWHMYRAQDSAKDQSYVLHVLGQGTLSRSLFPVASLTKSEVREHARRFGLFEIAAKPESQEVCFVPGRDHAAFLRDFLPRIAREGEMVDPAGNVVGSHGGSFAFTIGQRRGLGISTGEPNYVIDIDASANRVVVGPGDLLRRVGLRADRVTWIAGEPPFAAGRPSEIEVQIRYKGDPIPAVATVEGESEVRVDFAAAQRAVAPGQSAVFYRGDEVLGGGRIVEALS